MINLNKVENFPELTRSGRVSGELQAIIDALVDSANNGSRFCLDGVEPGKAYNSMQQRIRAQAKKLNFKVIIRFDADAEKLYFKASRAAGQEMVPVTQIVSDEVIETTEMATEVTASSAKIKTAPVKAKIAK